MNTDAQNALRRHQALLTSIRHALPWSPGLLQVEVFLLVCSKDAALSSRDITRVLGADPQNVSQAVERLKQHGFVSTKTEKRETFVTAAPLGKNTIDRALAESIK